MQCPCQSGNLFHQCCEPILTGRTHAETAEQLMRARYTAYTQLKMDFIEETHDPATRSDFDRTSSREWAETTKWRGLEILTTQQGGRDDETGTVEFKATFETDQGPQVHHEVSEFRRRNGMWYFVDGKPPGIQPVVRREPKVGRNDPCPCGSGKKFKKCCGIV